jgi:hypothetical protein
MLTRTEARLAAVAAAIWLAFVATAAFVTYYPSCQEDYGEKASNDPAICDGLF